MTSEDQSLFRKQMVFCGLGVLACLVCALADYRWLKKLAWPLYGAGIVTLILALMNGAINGSARWINVGGFSLQTSEVAKLALIITLAMYLERHQRKIGSFKFGIVYTSLIIGPVLVLILAEPDFGTTVCLGAVAGAMLLIGGVRLPHLACIGLAGSLVVGATLMQNPNRMHRITAFLNPEQHEDGAALQGLRATKAVTLGSVFGMGLGDGPFKRGQIYAQHSDAIFSVVGAEFGLVGSLAILTLYLCFLASCTFIAWHARDAFGMLLASGVTFFICLQSIIHLAGVTGLMPIKGFPLPFLSHGGTNLMFNLVAVGLVFSIARRGVARARSRNPFESHIDLPLAKAT
jgi:cell division protein FtsW